MGICLSCLVEQSWDRFAAVFSDRIGSVSRGLLFAPYVDYESYGRWLAEAIQRENPPPGQFRFYDHPTPYAVNFRTARRLGIASNNPALSNASAVFPRSLAR